MELKIIRDYEITLDCSIFIYVSCDCSIIFILYCEIGENKNVGIYRKKSWWVRWETRAETSFRHAYTTEIASRVRQPDTNLRMNHAQVYVNRTRPKYTYTPGAFTSSFERRFPHFRCTPPPLSTAITVVLYLHVSVRHTWIFRNIISLDEFDFSRPLKF